jgi:hypothetical protein
MGLARELTMGKRKRSTIAATGPWPKLNAMYARHLHGMPVDPAKLKATIEEAHRVPGRRRFAEGAILNDACRLYRELTGESIGAETEHY